jgi:WD40 repeat protein
MTSCGDRFIPNRSRLNPSQSHHTWLNRVDENKDNVPPPESEYKRQLRRALFGNEPTPSTLLGLGEARQSLSSSIENPFHQDVLRTIDSSTSLKAPAKKHAVNYRTVNTKHDLALETPDVLTDDRLNLLSTGPGVAVAMGSTVVISKGGKIDDIRPCAAGGVSSVKWNYSGHTLMAVGLCDEVQVWNPETKQKHAILYNHTSYVTALEWKGSMDLVASSGTEVQRYDLRISQPEIGAYYGLGCRDLVTQLQWNDHILAAAAGNRVCLWDVRYGGRDPLQEFQHEGVKGLAFCPRQRNVLATGGDNGIQLWNVQSGSLRATIPTPDPVSSLLWSPYRNEVMASYGEVMGIWSLAPKVHQLAEWGPPTRGGRILTLDRFPDTGHVISLHAEEVLLGWKPFGEPPRLPKTRTVPSLGTLDMAVIR